MREKSKGRLEWVYVAAICATLVVGCGGGDGSSTASTPSTGGNSGGTSIPEAAPDFGPNVTIINPSMSVADINQKLQSLAGQSTGFDENRAAVLFMPGAYGSAAGQANPATATGYIDSPVGFMMTVQGLGASPEDVVVNGNLRVGATGTGALSTFWRSLANLKVTPIQSDEPSLTMRWNASQASPIRRVHIAGNLDLAGGVAFGSFIGNTKIDGQVKSGFTWTADADPVTGQVDQGQAHYYTRDSVIGGWQGRSANFVFSGVAGAPQAAFAPGDKTVLATTPVSREAPFLFYDGQRYKVFVPSASVNSAGVHWGVESADGVSLPISEFYIAKPTDTASMLNAQLAQGKNLLLTPGIYKVDQPIHVTKANAVVLGLGMATVTPVNGTSAISIDDVPGVVISSLVVDANTQASATLVQVGPPGANQGSATNPTTLSDIFVRVGGAYAGTAATSIEINQNNVLVDHTWLWRADHGNAATTGWAVNQADTGLVVNGNNVTVLGLFVEHYQKSQVIWNGNGGRTIFMECEAPYDPPSQSAWMNGALNGYPCYAVGAGVSSHNATGLASWTLFFMGPIQTHNAVSVPSSPNVQITNITAGVVAGMGGFENIINGVGGAVVAGSPASFVQGLSAIGQVAAYP
ncbi:hypothetical protein [Cupriavidus metallidurans]|uniref:hypothetical protein n=1 Tax=Cupriavidus metallidurans TaxID=119219 RepID=UPI001CCC6543|nr:hypothetical protein [Cupriavidus metallidurans]UBM09374.1 hypothetical protein LAI70_05640 [Cupriavidus metallidurans]